MSCASYRKCVGFKCVKKVGRSLYKEKYRSLRKTRKTKKMFSE